ncbi:MAG: NAD(P)H-quinone oxidoreductase [Actinomycetaceae bacterium]|nr:NAD(P)H-quinone oxidoreductase [Actinomycetaceae bacterium]
MKAIISVHDRDQFDPTAETALSDRLMMVEIPTPQPRPGEVRIKVSATAINPADILQAKGAYPPPKGASYVLGLECSGTIDAVGSDIATDPDFSWIQEGVPACALLSAGGYAEYVCVDARQVLPIPKVPGSELAPEIAVMGLIESAAASWMVLETIGGLANAPESSVLIHGASGGVGSIAVQLAREWGHRVYGTAGAPDRCYRVEQLGANTCFNYHDDWYTALKKHERRGVDVIMDVLGGSGLKTNVRALKRYGHLVVLGLLGGPKGELNVGRLLSKNASITAQTLRSQVPQKKFAIVDHLRHDVWPLVESGKIQPVIGKVLPFDSIANAHAVVSGKAGEDVLGKVVIRVS